MPHLHSNGLEEAGVPERQLHHLLNLGQLLPAAADVIVANVIQALLLILSLWFQTKTPSENVTKAVVVVVVVGGGGCQPTITPSISSFPV